MEVLRTKHSDARPPSVACLNTYTEKPPEMVPVDITDDVVSAVAGRLSGGAGPGGTDSVSLQHWLLQFGAASGELRQIVAEFGEWISNGRPPWSAYCAMVSGRLIALDKSPGIRPVGHHGAIGGPWGPPIADPFSKLRDNLPQLTARRPEPEEPVLDTDRVSPPWPRSS